MVGGELQEITKMAFLHLQEWVEVAASHFNKVDSGLSLFQKRVLWDTVLCLNPSYGNIALCPEVTDKWKVACCLAFILRCRCIEEEWNYFPLRPSKPELFLTMNADLSVMEENFSRLVTDGNNKIFFDKENCVFKHSYKHRAYFRTCTIKDGVEAALVAKKASDCDVVFSPWTCLPHLQASDFSSVLIYGDYSLSPLELEKIYATFPPEVSIALFTSSSFHSHTDIIEEVNKALNVKCQEPLPSPSPLSPKLLHESICFNQQTEHKPARKGVASKETRKRRFTFIRKKSSYLQLDECMELNEDPFCCSKKAIKRRKKKKTPDKRELEFAITLTVKNKEETRRTAGKRESSGKEKKCRKAEGGEKTSKA